MTCMAVSIHVTGAHAGELYLITEARVTSLLLLLLLLLQRQPILSTLHPEAEILWTMNISLRLSPGPPPAQTVLPGRKHSSPRLGFASRAGSPHTAPVTTPDNRVTSTGRIATHITHGALLHISHKAHYYTYGALLHISS